MKNSSLIRTFVLGAPNAQPTALAALPKGRAAASALHLDPPSTSSEPAVSASISADKTFVASSQTLAKEARLKKFNSLLANIDLDSKEDEAFIQRHTQKK